METDAKCNVYLAKLKQDIEAIQNHDNSRAAENQQENKPVSSKEDLELLSAISALKGYESVNE